MSKVTCSAVLTDAATWCLLRYEPRGANNNPKFVSSEEIYLDVMDPKLPSVCRKLISRMAQMLVQQMALIDTAFAQDPKLLAASQNISLPIGEED